MPEFSSQMIRATLWWGFLKGKVMAICETCGNDYDDTFRITIKGRNYDFDSFECAVHALAPVCEHCGCRILGHGVQFDDTIFCCVHCASTAGVTGLADHTRSGIIAEAI
jgi:hypothetical protein